MFLFINSANNCCITQILNILIRFFQHDKKKGIEHERATDMIDSFTVAIANGLTATQLMRAVRPHPTFLEAVGEALDALEGRAIHS